MEKKNGVVETHYGNGQLESRANYKDGKLDGFIDWWHNGQIKLRANYKDGVAVKCHSQQHGVYVPCLQKN